VYCPRNRKKARKLKAFWQCREFAFLRDPARRASQDIGLFGGFVFLFGGGGLIQYVLTSHYQSVINATGQTANKTKPYVLSLNIAAIMFDERSDNHLVSDFRHLT
jgi:hypothetical protein